MTVIQPLLPTPGFFARLLHSQPDVYYFTKANPTPKIRVSYSFNIDGLVTTDQPIVIKGPGTKLVTLVHDIFSCYMSTQSLDLSSPIANHDVVQSSEITQVRKAFYSFVSC